jgi:hypothetical protein
MSLNDESEKLRQAEEWLSDPELLVTDEKFKAAWEHVMYVYNNTLNCELKSQSTAIFAKMMGKDWLN